MAIRHKAEGRQPRDLCESKLKRRPNFRVWMKQYKIYGNNRHIDHLTERKLAAMWGSASRMQDESPKRFSA